MTIVWKNRFNEINGVDLGSLPISGSLDVYDSREYVGTWPTPITRALQASEQIFSPPRNRWDLMDKFVENDPELAAGIEIKASMVRKSYRGLRLKVGEIATPEEDVLMEYLKSLDKWLNIKRIFLVVTEKIIRYGDWPMLKVIKGGLPGLKHLPIKYMSVVDNITQLEDVDAQIFNGNYYVLNEYREAKRKIFHRKRILHFSIKPEGSEIYDQYGRYTFGIWSPSLLLPLTQYVLWKHNIIIDDIMIRHKMIPREIHAVNTLGINPQTVGEAGDDLQTRETKADAEINRVLTEYERNIAYMSADRGYIHQAEGVAISILEPKSGNYLKPNEAIDQINAAYAKRLGVPVDELTTISSASYAGAVIKTSFSTVRTIDIAECIADKLLEFIREHIINTYPVYAKYVEDIYIDIDLVMDQEEERRFRIAALMKQSEVFTSDEIREVCGYEGLTEEQQKKIDEVIEKQSLIKGRTPDNVASQSTQKRSSNVSGFPDTPAQKEKEQVGLGNYVG